MLTKSSLLNLKSLISRLSKWSSMPNILIGLCLSSLVINLLGLVFPLTLLQIYDRIIPHSSINTLTLLVLGVMAALLFEAVLRISRASISAWTDARFEHRAGCKAFHQLLHTNLTDYEREGSGAHLERINSLNTLKDFYAGQAVTAIFDTPFVLLYLGLIAYIGGYLVIVPIIMLCLLVLRAGTLGKKLRAVLAFRRDTDDRRLNFIIEVLSGIHTIKAMAMESQILRRYERLLQSTANVDHKISLTNTSASSTSNIISQGTMVLVAGVGSIFVINGLLTVGGLAACTLLAGRCLQPINRSMGVWTRLQSIRIAQERLHQETHLPQEEASKLPPFGKVVGNIELRNVSFHYNEDTPVLQKLNLSIKAGESVSFNSACLSGKSTLLWIIMGILTPNSGNVLIDGKDIHEYNAESLRRQIAYLPQEGIIFDGTIMENLTLFRGYEYTEKAKRIIAVMGLSDFINQLPKGFNTHIGQHAVEALPRGIKQRLTIARALIDEPKIILFDEANTAIDMRADGILKNVLQALKRHGSTTVFVSHRPSLLKLADRHYQLQDGYLVQI